MLISKGMIHYIRLIIRFFFGAMLFIAAIGKMADNRYFAEILGRWELFPNWSLIPIGVVAILSELGLSIWLFSGQKLRLAAFVTALFHFTYTVLTILSLSKGVRLDDCGCFGIFFKHPLDWIMVWEDFGFTILALFLARLAKADSKKSKLKLENPPNTRQVTEPTRTST